MRALLRSRTFHRFAGGFAFGVAVMLATKPAQAAMLGLGLIG